MQIITPTLKDAVLFYLCTNAKAEKLSEGKTADTLKELNIDFDTFNAIMVQFQRFGFVEDLNLRRSNIMFVLRTDAHDYAQKGGFVAQEEVFKSNIEKLMLEIDHLKMQLAPDQLDTANKISTIGSALLSGLTLFK